MNLNSMMLDDMSLNSKIVTAQQPSLVSTGGQFAYAIFVLIAMLSLIYITSRVVKKSRFNLGASKNIKFIDRMTVGIGLTLAIILVDGRYFLISVSKENINYITELDGDHLILEDLENKIEFKDYFNTFINNGKIGDRRKKNDDDDEKN